MLRPHPTARLVALVRRLGRRWQELRRDLLVQMGPLVGVLLVLWGTIWALGAYHEHKSHLRLAETTRYVAQFREEPVAGAWRRLALAWQTERPRQEVLLTQIASRERGENVALRHREFVLQTIARHRLAADIDTVFQFFKRLTLCIRMGSCDARLAAERLGVQARSFRNQHYPYLVEEYPGEDVDAPFDILALADHAR